MKSRLSCVLLLAILVISASCKKTITLPVVTTTDVSSIDQTSAVSGGSVTDDGGSAILSRGVCWSTSAQPSISDSRATQDGTTGAFTISLTLLNPNTVYYVRAYATNKEGTSYGNQISFTTSQVPAAATEWIQQTSNTTANLRGVAFSDLNTWVAVGDAGKIIRSTDGGIHWVDVTSPVGDALHCVSFRGNLGIAVGVAGRVLRSTDAGLTWTEETRPTSKILFSVSIGTTMTVITGEEGTILVSLDDGLTWNAHTAGTASIIFGVSVNGGGAVGVGGQGAIVMSTDNGKGWGLTVPGGQLTFFYSTSFVTSAIGWAVGSTSSPGNVIIHSTDGGFVWTQQTPPNNEQLFGVSFANLLSGTAVGSNGTIITTTDGGTNWAIQASGTTQILNAVSFANPNYGIIVGDGGTVLLKSN